MEKITSDFIDYKYRVIADQVAKVNFYRALVETCDLWNDCLPIASPAFLSIFESNNHFYLAFPDGDSYVITPLGMENLLKEKKELLDEASFYYDADQVVFHQLVASLAEVERANREEVALLFGVDFLGIEPITIKG